MPILTIRSTARSQATPRGDPFVLRRRYNFFGLYISRGQRGGGCFLSSILTFRRAEFVRQEFAGSGRFGTGRASAFGGFGKPMFQLGELADDRMMASIGTASEDAMVLRQFWLRGTDM